MNLGMTEASGLTLLSAMITPAVLISACGTLIFSTSNRLARVVDRVRSLLRLLEQLFTEGPVDFVAERREELDRQLAFYASRSSLIQRALTALYFALGLFVGATVSIGLVAFVPRINFIPSALGIAGTLVLFYGCVLLIAEARVALRSVSSEMAFTLNLSELYRRRPRAEGK
jgi:hypothetical protein